MNRRGTFLLAMATGLVGMASIAPATVVVANFEDGLTDGFGTGTNSGVTANAFASPTTGTVITPGSGTDTTKVLDLFASGFNGGLSSGADLGYDFKANGLATQFLANDVLSFQWEVAPGTQASGFSQLFNIILNAPGAGFTAVGGSGGNTSPLAVTTGTVNQFPPFSGQLNTVSINYDAYKGAGSRRIPALSSWKFRPTTQGVPLGRPISISIIFTLSSVPRTNITGPAGLGGAGMLRVGDDARESSGLVISKSTGRRPKWSSASSFSLVVGSFQLSSFLSRIFIEVIVYPCYLVSPISCQAVRVARRKKWKILASLMAAGAAAQAHAPDRRQWQ